MKAPIALGALALLLSICAQATVAQQPAPAPIVRQTQPMAPGAAGQQAVLLTVQVVDGPKSKAVMEALAQSVLLVPANQVTLVAGLDQSRLLGAQSVITFRAVGPTTNGLPLLTNCETNTKALFLRSSAARAAVIKATNTWWKVGDAVKIQKADCTAQA